MPLAPARPQRLAFAGTPAEAVPALRALAAAGFDIGVVVTGAAARRSRRGSDSPSPVAAAAARLGLRVSHDPADLARCEAECAVVVAYGHLMSADLLAAIPMLNLHFSLLPRWRGAAPVERALLAGDASTGVCLMAMAPKLDTGPLYWCHRVHIGPSDTAADLRSRLALDGAERLAASLRSGLPAPVPQQGEATYAHKLSSADRRIDWGQPAALIDRQIRAGGAWTAVDGRRLIIRKASLHASPPSVGAPVGAPTGKPADAQVAAPALAPVGAPAATAPPPGMLIGDHGDLVVTGQGLIRLAVVQPAGRPALDAQAWLHGARLKPGTCLGQPGPGP